LWISSVILVIYTGFVEIKVVSGAWAAEFPGLPEKYDRLAELSLFMEVMPLNI